VLHCSAVFFADAVESNGDITELGLPLGKQLCSNGLYALLRL
jgi:hypothetical protein